jgi:caffeoyl-CoA O-methyltransferase
MLWSGKVADPSDTSPTTQAIRDTNALVGSDPRVFAAMLPIGDGVLAAWVR